MANRSSLIILTVVIMMVLAIPETRAELATDTIATSDGELVIHPVHHATFVMIWNDTTIYVDPVGGAELFSDFDKPDLILITHIHGDHTSAETVEAVATGATTIVAPATVAEKLGDGMSDRFAIIACGESYESNGIQVEAVPAYNLAEDRLQFHPKERGDNAYVVTIGGKRIFISGDTEGVPEMRALDGIDAAFVCMNLPYTMDVDQAADAVLDFAPGIVYPYHFQGKGGASDLGKFTKLVASNPAIEVRILAWY